MEDEIQFEVEEAAINLCNAIRSQLVPRRDCLQVMKSRYNACNEWARDQPTISFGEKMFIRTQLRI